MLEIKEKLTSLKSKVSEKSTKACLAVSTSMLSAGLMTVQASADDGGTSFDTVISYAGKALSFCTSNDVMSIIFYCSMAGAVFGVIKKAKRAVR
jgi:hypothetical protein